MKIIFKIIIGILCLFFANYIFASIDPNEKRLLGIWHLLQITSSDATGKIVSPHAMYAKGYLVYAPNHRVIVFSVDDGRIKPKAEVSTSTESQLLLNSMRAYAGTFSIKKNKIIHHVDISANEFWNGKNLIRTFKFENNHLILTLPASKTADGNSLSLNAIWEKE